MSDEDDKMRSVEIGSIPTMPLRRRRKRFLELDEETLDKIQAVARLQCTQKEAAGVLGCSASTLEQFIQANPAAREAWWTGRQEGRYSLRRLLWKQAESDSKVAMFLAKDTRWLGMQEKAAQVTNIDNRQIIIADEENTQRIRELVRKAKTKAIAMEPESE
jgi:hypothetical protein